MPKQLINPPGLPVPPSFARGLEVSGPGRTIYLGGAAPIDEDGNTVDIGDMRAQALQCLGKLARIVEHAGGTMDDVVSLTFFVTDFSDREGYHAARAEYWPGEYQPAVMGGQIDGLYNPEWLIEIAGIAFIED